MFVLFIISTINFVIHCDDNFDNQEDSKKIDPLIKLKKKLKIEEPSVFRSSEKDKNDLKNGRCHN